MFGRHPGENVPSHHGYSICPAESVQFGAVR